MGHLKPLYREQMKSLPLVNEAESNRRVQSMQKNIHIFFEEIVQHLQIKSKMIWGAYQALKNEPTIDWLSLADCFPVSWAFPVIQEESLSYIQPVSMDITKNWNRSTLGVYEPTDGAAVQATDLAGVFIPALAFHVEGYRLGRGKGYYDKTFHQANLVKVGIAFEERVRDDVPYEEHDLKMNYIITDQRIIDLVS